MNMSARLSVVSAGHPHPRSIVNRLQDQAHTIDRDRLYVVEQLENMELRGYHISRLYNCCRGDIATVLQCLVAYELGILSVRWLREILAMNAIAAGTALDKAVEQVVERSSPCGRPAACLS